MKSTESWWRAEINWETPSGRLLRKFFALLPRDRQFQITLFGSAPLQMTVDQGLLSGDVDLFCGDDFDLASMAISRDLGKDSSGLHIEPGFELSFRTSPRWRNRAKVVPVENVILTIPHPLDILIGKLNRLSAKDLEAFKRVIQITGHPTPQEMIGELQNAVDLFRPGFEEESPNQFLKNTERLWQEIFHQPINVRRDIIAPALARRKKGYGEPPPEYKDALREL